MDGVRIGEDDLCGVERWFARLFLSWVMSEAGYPTRSAEGRDYLFVLADGCVDEVERIRQEHIDTGVIDVESLSTDIVDGNTLASVAIGVLHRAEQLKNSLQNSN